jgi:hypothetical protein
VRVCVCVQKWEGEGGEGGMEPVDEFEGHGAADTAMGQPAHGENTADERATCT